MNAAARLDSAPRLEDFPYRLSDNVRFADLDPNQHERLANALADVVAALPAFSSA